MELNQVAESISAINTPSIGIAGEVRCVVTGVDGEVKTDTGFQKNLILNQGLNFFGGGKGDSINKSCVIGSGSSTPTVTQNSLDSPIALALDSDTTSNYSYDDKGDGMYRMWEQKKYRFTGLNNVNISEVGLASSKKTSADTPIISDFYLTTRALIKDSEGNAVSITIKTGETLDIFYKVHKVIDIREKSFIVNLDDGAGNTTPYNVTKRAFAVGSSSGLASIRLTEMTRVTAHSSDFFPITQDDVTPEIIIPSSMSTYENNSFKRTLYINFSLSQANMHIRTITSHHSVWNRFLPFQLRFGRVSDDAPITKTDKHTMSIPLEFSWGRYEGEL